MSLRLGVAYLHPGMVSHSFMDSLWLMASYEEQQGNTITRWAIESGPLDLPEARNLAVGAFLNSDSEWLLFVDSDVGFKRDTYSRLLDCEQDAVSAVVVGQFRGKPDRMGGYDLIHRPLLYARSDAGFAVMAEYPEDSLVRVGATGAGCLLVHRRAYEKVGSDWFTRITREGGLKAYGEDFSFCERLARIGHPLHVHTGIPTTHHKYTYLSHGV